jgi:hypothetical protein
MFVACGDTFIAAKENDQTAASTTSTGASTAVGGGSASGGNGSGGVASGGAGGAMSSGNGTGGAGGAGCLHCNQALDAPNMLPFSAICEGGADKYASLIECICFPSGGDDACVTLCAPYCTEGMPLPSECLTCLQTNSLCENEYNNCLAN